MDAIVIRNDVGMAQGAEDRHFGVELFAFFVGHFDVVYFFATEDL